MTIVLGAVAALLLLLVVAAIVASRRDDGVLEGTLPEDLDRGIRLSQASPPAQPLMNASTAPVAPASIDRKRTRHAYQAVESIVEERALQSSGTRSVADFSPGNLGVGTTLSYRGVDSRIFGVLSFGNTHAVWHDYLAEHAAGQWWRFGVDTDRGMQLSAYEPQNLAIEPGPETIVHDGQSYQLVESGQANYRSAGQTGQRPDGHYEYFDYAQGQVLISFERFDYGPWQTAIGHAVDPSAVTVCNALPPEV